MPTFEELTNEISNLKKDKDKLISYLNSLEGLREMFRASELETATIKAHEPYRDFSGHIVSGKQHDIKIDFDSEFKVNINEVVESKIDDVIEAIGIIEQRIKKINESKL